METEECVVCGKENEYTHTSTLEVWGTPVLAEYTYSCSCGYHYYYMHGIQEHAFRESKSFVTTYEDDFKVNIKQKLRLLAWRLAYRWTKSKKH